jgi:tetraacyldisaccharide 4'-kinase
MIDLSRFHYRLVHQGAKNKLESLLLLLLIPLAMLYGSVNWLRNFLYDFGIKRSYQSTIPVVSVGNITAGGTGKTPVVDFLVKYFLENGKRPVVVSRGYGGSFNDHVGIVSDGEGIQMDASLAGDEPVLLARRNPRCPVLIAKKRVDGVKLVERDNLADLVILDDGFQHRALKRNADIVLLDARCPLGNGYPLPAGNLREFKTGLKRADLILRTKCTNSETKVFQGLSTYNSQYQLADNIVCLDGTSLHIDELKNLKVLAFSGIANPEQFFTDLENLGITLHEKIALVDHVDYTNDSVIDHLKSCSERNDVMITTEKDAVKLVSGMFELCCYYVPIEITIDGSDDFTRNLNKLLWSR